MHSRHALPLGFALSLLLSGIGATTDAFAQIDIGIGGISVGIGGDGVSVGTGGDGGVSVGVGGDNGINVGVGSDGVEVGLGNIDIDANFDEGDGGGSGGAGGTGEPGHVLTQEQTLDAVRKKRAVPLAPIVTSIRQPNVEVIDAQLLSVRGILVYQLRIIGEGGSVRELYFYARTGKQVMPD